MAGFRRPEVPRAQMVLWSHRLDDAIPPDHPVRQFEYLLRADAFSETFAAWEREYVLAEGKPPKPIASTTDPESRVMPDKEGKSKPNYNPQVGVDASKGVIVSADVTDAADDAGQLTPELAQVASNCDRLPAEASADSNYNTGPELEQLERWGVTGLLPDSGQRSEVPDPESPSARAVSAAQSGETLSDEQWSALPKDREGRITKAAFRYDAEADVYHCPMGHTLTFLRNSQDRKKWGTAIRAQYGSGCACATCPRASMCCRDPGRGRTISRDQYEPCRERLRARMAGEVGRRHYRLRRQTVEPRIGLIKHGLGLRRFLRRGLAAAKTEWMLACTAVNVGILLRNWDVVQAVL